MPFELVLSCDMLVYVSFLSGKRKVLNIGYRDRIGWGFFISDIGGDIGDTRAYRAFMSDIIYSKILITKSWFNVIDIIYLTKMM